MPFPAKPTNGESESQFRIDDPFGMRRAVIPLLEIGGIHDQCLGLGTAFRVDQFNTYLSAQHVLEHRLERQHSTVAVGLLSLGLVYGRVQVPNEYFLRIQEAFTFRGKKEDPLLALQGRYETTNAFDCIRLHVDAENPRLSDHVNPLPIKLSNSSPRISEKVLAIGYPQLPQLFENASEPIREQMYGAFGIVKEIYPVGRDSKHAWPMFRVDADWRGGMSGGPIFNEDGHVIGLVSSSLAPDGNATGAGYGFWFRHIPFIEKFLPTICPNNPGSNRCWAVLRPKPWHLDSVHISEERARLRLREMDQQYEIRYGVYRNGTDDFIA